MKSQFADITSSSNFFDVVLFLLSSLVTGPSFMSISSLVLELWQFSFIRDWPEIRKSDITPSEFCPISGDRGELEIPNLAQMFLMKCYRMLQNASYGFYRFWPIKGKPTGRVKLLSHHPSPPPPPSHPPRLRVKLAFCPIKKIGPHFWSIWKSICCWFDKNFLEVVTDIYSKNQVILEV